MYAGILKTFINPQINFICIFFAIALHAEVRVLSPLGFFIYGIRLFK